MPIGFSDNFVSFPVNKAGTSKALQANFKRLSTGFRINQASDDASGLAISENLRSLVRSLQSAERNTNNAISMANVADGGLDQVSGITTRMRELAVQAADGSLSEVDRGYIDTEYQALKGELDRITETTEFNGKELLAGPQQNLDMQVGEGSTGDDRIALSVGGIDTSALGLDATSLAGTDGSGASAAIDAIDSAQQTVNQRRAEFGAVTNRLERAVSNTQTRRTGIAGANSRIRDADIAEETSKLAQNQVLQRARIAIRAQANTQSALGLKLLK